MLVPRGLTVLGALGLAAALARTGADKRHSGAPLWTGGAVGQTQAEPQGAAAKGDGDLQAQDAFDRALLAAIKAKKRRTVPVSEAEAEHEQQVLAELEAKDQAELAAEIAKAEKEASEKAEAMKAAVQLQQKMEKEEAEKRAMEIRAARDMQAQYEAELEAESKREAEFEAWAKAHPELQR
ncbi:unnamed protein product [Prorocentrum cordatum]|uniref:Uncharacterized protein n=1 Tax=Prorocentrum cordatum TaxID=2364126 RepID=A0ABN9PU04_9DINO|nr:unnamed protein product [Polarella glacialis]